MKLLSGLLLAATLMYAADANPAADNAVLGAANDFAQATLKADKAALQKLMSEDVIFSHSSGRTESKLEYIQNVVAGKPKYDLLDMSDSIVRVYGKMALLRCKMNVKTTQNGQSTSLSLSVLMNWVKDGKGWHLVARQATRLN
jgi:ketosteroid isomerase-like protein